MGARGIEWNADFQAKCDRASRLAFGIVEADTRLERPDRHTYDRPEGFAAHLFVAEDLVSYDAALDAWDRWTEEFEVAAEYAREGLPFLTATGVILDFSDVNAVPMRCGRSFVRQMLVTALGVHPNARLRTAADREAEQSAAWGAAIEEEARRFKRQG